MRPVKESGKPVIRKFKQSPRFPHKRSEGLTTRRHNKGTKALLILADLERESDR